MNRPSGWPAPATARLDGREIDLLPLAREVARRHLEAHPEELERYGEAGREWGGHDNQHILNWAVGDVAGHTDLEREVRWLAGVLEAREFPLARLARDLELAAEVVRERVAGATEIARRLDGGAAFVRSTESFLTGG